MSIESMWAGVRDSEKRLSQSDVATHHQSCRTSVKQSFMYLTRAVTRFHCIRIPFCDVLISCVASTYSVSPPGSVHSASHQHTNFVSGEYLYAAPIIENPTCYTTTMRLSRTALLAAIMLASSNAFAPSIVRRVSLVVEEHHFSCFFSFDGFWNTYLRCQ